MSSNDLVLWHVPCQFSVVSVTTFQYLTGEKGTWLTASAGEPGQKRRCVPRVSRAVPGWRPSSGTSVFVAWGEAVASSGMAKARYCAGVSVEGVRAHSLEFMPHVPCREHLCRCRRRWWCSFRFLSLIIWEFYPKMRIGSICYLDTGRVPDRSENWRWILFWPFPFLIFIRNIY